MPALGFCCVTSVVLPGGCGDDSGSAPVAPNIRESSSQIAERTAALLAEREELDRTVWAREIDALRHERFTVDLWDRINAADDKLGVLAGIAFESLHLPAQVDSTQLENDIHVTTYEQNAVDAPAAAPTHDQSSWRQMLEGWVQAGWRLEMAEFYHEDFDPAEGDKPAESLFSFKLYALNASTGIQSRVTIEAEARVLWANAATDNSDAVPTPTEITITKARMIRRDGLPWFVKAATIDPTPRYTEPQSVSPLMVYDLNGDGRLEVIAAGANEVYWRGESGRLRIEPLMDYAVKIRQTAVLGDFTGDGYVDLITESIDGQVVLYRGDAEGRFRGSPSLILDDTYNVMAITAGDIDGDNDLDLWLGQYLPPYRDGQLPTPYYDANDGLPAYLLRNEGDGRFTDVTEAAGLAAKRHRRTYSASLVDLDEDDDLDLLTVNDFASVDLYLNDGTGRFTDTSDSVADRHNFGMAHAFADFNADGHGDALVIGMSNAVARRLDAMGLNRPGFDEHQAMRATMAYGNKLYLSDGYGEGGYTTAPFMDQIARTGWSWGVSAFDFDSDGDNDAAIGNGHISGATVEDYNSVFWRHDLFTGTSEPDPAVHRLTFDQQSDLGITIDEQPGRSWDGYQKNALMMNINGRGFVDVGYQMGVAGEFDTRSVVTADIDADGLPDLLVSEEPAEAHNTTGQVLHIYRNTGGGESASHGWIGVRLRQHGNGFSPIGAKVIARTPNGEMIRWIVTGDSFRAQHPPVAIFGLGDRDHAKVESIEVRWPNGVISRIESPATEQYHDVLPPPQ